MRRALRGVDSDHVSGPSIGRRSSISAVVPAWMFKAQERNRVLHAEDAEDKEDAEDSGTPDSLMTEDKEKWLSGFLVFSASSQPSARSA